MTKKDKLSEYLRKRLSAHQINGNTDMTVVFEEFLTKGQELADATAVKSGPDAGRAVMALFEDVAIEHQAEYGANSDVPATHENAEVSSVQADVKPTVVPVEQNTGRLPWRTYFIGAAAGILIALTGVYFYFSGTVTLSRGEVAVASAVIQDVRTAVDRIDGMVGAGLPNDHPLARRTGRWLRWQDAFPEIYDDMSLATKREGEGIFQLTDEGGWKAIFQSPVCSVATQLAPELVDPMRLGDTTELCHDIGRWNDLGASL